MVEIKRAYDEASQSDGYRVLVDRIWPRGVSKADAKIDLWLKDIGPSTDLRKWFNHDPAKFSDFKKRYNLELQKNNEFNDLQEIVHDKSKVTLVYGAKDELHNQAVVLQEKLKHNV